MVFGIFMRIYLQYSLTYELSVSKIGYTVYPFYMEKVNSHHWFVYFPNFFRQDCQDHLDGPGFG